MFSKSWGYAIRALVRLAETYEDSSSRSMASELAEETGMPASFLSKVLQQMTAGGLISSSRGRGGGVRLSRKPSEISLAEIARLTGDLDGNRLDLEGMDGAIEHVSDRLNKRWKPYERAVTEFLHETNLEDLRSKTA